MASSVTRLLERVAATHAISPDVITMAVRACAVEGIESTIDVAFLEHVPMPSSVALFKGANAAEAARLLHLSPVEVAACKAEWAEQSETATVVRATPIAVALPQRRPVKRRKIVIASSSSVAPRVLEPLLTQDTRLMADSVAKAVDFIQSRCNGCDRWRELWGNDRIPSVDEMDVIRVHQGWVEVSQSSGPETAWC